MIDIPIGKTFTVMESKLDCRCGNCDFFEYSETTYDCGYTACHENNRKDGKSVIFKLVDYPVSTFNPYG
jgi:hypothetical protein